MKEQRIYIALIPSKTELEKLNLTSNNLYHTTLRTSFYTNKLQRIINLLEITRKKKPINLKIKEIKQYNQKTIAIELEKNKEIQKLHENTIHLTQPLITKPYTQKEKNLTKNQEHYQEIYGSPFILEYYNPHITITKQDKPKIEEIKNKIITLEEIAIITKPEEKIIYKYKLK
ncbi:DUF1045 domain-containing protein [Candidatus Woesearchaeota archaeon]|nr:DUF1045 domain-containing protein [Candidatus Woesearchaeota archaeon]